MDLGSTARYDVPKSVTVHIAAGTKNSDNKKNIQ